MLDSFFFLHFKHSFHGENSISKIIENDQNDWVRYDLEFDHFNVLSKLVTVLFSTHTWNYWKISIPHLRTRAVRVQERNTGTTFQHKLGNERRIGNFELIGELFEVDNIISKRSLQNNRQNSFKFDILCLKSKD